MSADRRRQGRGNIFDAQNWLSLEETDAAVFGTGIEDVDAGRQVARPLSIFEIQPDLAQPRRTIPSIVRPYWDGNAETTSTLFNAWYGLAVQERGAEFDLKPYLEADHEIARPQVVRPIEASLLELVELAANIRQNGLTNPITVGPSDGGVYRLETGERRWLAYHLLYAWFQSERKTWERIPARIVADISVWRQASENNARANLNAISRARQLAILLMDLHQALGVKFQPFEALVQPGQIDRPYYAQVADGYHFPVPPGKAEAVMNAMGFKQSSLMSEYRKLLELPDEVWRLADDLNWTQGRLRELKRRSGDDPEQMIELALQLAKKEKYGFGISQPDTPPLPQNDSFLVDTSLTSKLSQRRLRRMWSLAKRVGQGSTKITTRDLEELRLTRRWLDELERTARDNLQKAGKK